MKRSAISGAPKKKLKAIKKDPIEEYKTYINKKGNGIVEVLDFSNDDCLANVKQYISTQSIALDSLLNGVGIPTGRVTEIYGPPHIGKSTIIDHLFSSVQLIGGVPILFDSESARDINYTKRIGVDVSKLQCIEFKRDELYIENVMIQMYNTVEWWASNAPDIPVVIGWDALGGTSTRDEVKKRMESEGKPAGAAKVLSEACRLLPSKLGRTKVAIVIANHQYESFGKGKSGFGQATQKMTYGGSAVRHLASIRINLFNLGYINYKGEHIGRQIGAFLDKNRLGNPYKKIDFALISGIGIDNTWSIYETLKNAKIIVVDNSWSAINIDGEVIKFQGWNGLADKCKENPLLFNKLLSVYYAIMRKVM
jgi:recombination protein RecA